MSDLSSEPFFTSTQGAPSTRGAPLEVGPLTAGSMLRQMREAAGVDAGLLASALKVSLQKIEALESDQFDKLPDMTFARGLASAICRAFGADAAPVLERMPVAAPGLHAPVDVGGQPFRSAGDRPAPMVNPGISKPLAWAVVACLIGAVALWWLPTLPIQLGSSSPDGTDTAHAAAQGVVTQGVVAAPGTNAVADAASEPAPVMAELPAGAASAEQGAQAPDVAASGAATVVANEAGSAVAFEATAETWVTVRDANGKPLINRALNQGDKVSTSGDLPLSVTIGRKEAVTVQVHGKPFDIKSLSRSPVVRFEVK
jgi:cytoskeleton protein RodZ